MMGLFTYFSFSVFFSYYCSPVYFTLFPPPQSLMRFFCSFSLFLVGPKSDLLSRSTVLHWRSLHSPVRAGEAKHAEELPEADNRKAKVGTKQSRESDVGTLTLVRYPRLPSPLFEEGKEAGPLSKKALKRVLHLKTC